MGIVLPILVFFISMNATYAYFSAKTSGEAPVSTAVLTIDFSNNTSTTIDSNTITNSTRIIPGQTIAINTSIENTGSCDVYAIIELKIEVTRFGESDKETVLSKCYSFDGTTPVEVLETGENTYSTTAIILEAPNENKTNNYLKTFSLPYLIDFNTYGNEYQNGTLTYSLVGHAIQKDFIDNANTATEILLNNI